MSANDRYVYLLPAMVLLALLALLAVLFVTSGNASAAPCTPTAVSWDITDQVNCNGIPVPVNADIHIKNGGTLNLSSAATLRMNSDATHTYVIDVQNGGAIDVVSGSMITAGNPQYHYKFLVAKLARIQILQSTVRYAGYSSMADDALGLRVETDSATISHATFRDCHVGLYVKGASFTVDNSSFYNDYMSVVIAGTTAKPKLFDNHMNGSTDGVRVEDGAALIENNHIFKTKGFGVFLLRSNSVVRGNEINDTRIGIYFQTASPQLLNNDIHDNLNCIKGFFGDPIIKGNYIHSLIQDGISLIRTGGTIDGNKIRSSNDTYNSGITLYGVTTSVVNNDIRHVYMYGVSATQGSDLTIADNFIEDANYGIFSIDSHVNITHNSISLAYYGSTLFFVSGRIYDNDYFNNFYGMDFSYTNGSFLIEKNKFRNSNYTAFVLAEGDPTIRNNTFDANNRAIKVTNSRPTIEGNTFTNNPTGIYCYDGSEPVISNNTIIFGNFSVNFYLSRGILRNNTIMLSSNWSVFANKSYVEMYGNLIKGNGQKGIYLLRSGGTFEDNILSESGTGIYSFRSSVIAARNTFLKDSVGLYLDRSTASLDGDKFDRDSVNGIMATSSDLVMNGVNMSRNKIGITSDNCNLTITGGSFANDTTDLMIYSAASLHIDGTVFSGSVERTMLLWYLPVTTYIHGASFINNTGPLTINHSAVDIRATTFSGGIGSIDATDSDITVDQCDFGLMNTTAINMVQGDLAVSYTTFDANRMGIYAVHSSVIVTDSTVKGSNETGIQLEKSSLVLRGTRVIENMDGVLDFGFSSLDILNCNISSNRVYGIYMDDTTHLVQLNFTRKIINEDNAFMIRGKIYVNEGGQLYLLRVKLQFNSMSAGESGLIVKKGGALIIRESVISAYTPTVGYVLTAETGTLLEMTNDTIRHCGRGMATDSAGLMIYTPNTHLADLLFDNNSVGLQVVSASLTAADLRFTTNDYGLFVTDGEVTLYESTFLYSVQKDITLVRSTGTLVDSHVTYKMLDCRDDASILYVKWYLTVTALWNDNQPVESASVLVTDQNGAQVSATTDEQGMTTRMLVTEYRQRGLTPDGYFAYTPHKISVRTNELTVDMSQYVGMSMTVTVTMNDKEPPTILVTNPIAGEIQYSANVLFIGVAMDNGSSVISVELSLDGKNWFLANGTNAWSAFMTIPDGDHIVQIRAIDARGNTRIINFSLEVDTKSPLLQIFSPQDGLITNITSVLVTGKVHQGSQLLINEQPVTVASNGSFAQVIRLKEGQNIISAKAFAKDGRQTDASVVVTLDTNPPVITVAHPVPGYLTNESLLTVTVSANENATFYINGQVASTFGGKADGSVELSEGVNVITVRAVDKAGNSRSIQFNVTLDITRPILTVEKPSSVIFNTEKDRIALQGTTEVGANLTVNGKPLPLAKDGTFKTKVKLKMGKNIITITSKDKAGNVNSIELDITRKESFNYMELALIIILAVCIGIAVDGGTVMYFRKYYKPKAPATKDGKPLSKEAAEEQELEEGLEGEEGWDGKEGGDRRQPRRPPPGTKAEDETEFETVEDLGEF